MAECSEVVHEAIATTRLDWVDAAKGVGIALVVYGHFARGLNGAGLLSGPWFEHVDRWIYGFHMPLFFFLSGLFLARSLAHRGPWGLIKNKLDTLVYAYVLWSVSQSLLEVAFAGYTNGDVTWSVFPDLLWKPRAQFWFLYVLFLLFVLAAVLTQIWRRLPIAVFVASLGLFLSLPAWRGLMPLAMVGHYAVFFFAGAWWGSKPRSVPKAALWTLPLFAMASGLLVLGIETDSAWQVRLWSVCFACLGIGAVLALCCHRLPFAVFWVWLGKHSMFIFLSHVMAEAAARVLMHKVLGVTHWLPHLVIGLATGLLLCASIGDFLSRKKWDFLLTWTGAQSLVTAKFR